MIYRRKRYKIKPERLADFNEFFHTYLYPNQIRNGAKLVGRWVNESQDEIMALWEYRSMEEYHSIEERIRKTELHFKAGEKRQELGDLYIESSQDFMTSTAFPGSYQPPKHITAVSAYITNDNGDVLLVKNLNRSDTMEMPGGQVEEGETLEEAAHREVLEETGAIFRILGITGIYQNVSTGIICVVFRGEYVSGELRIQEGETTEAVFKNLTKENISSYVTRDRYRTRILDAMDPSYLPHEAYKLRPYEILSKFEVKKED